MGHCEVLGDSELGAGHLKSCGVLEAAHCSRDLIATVTHDTQLHVRWASFHAELQSCENK